MSRKGRSETAAAAAAPVSPATRKSEAAVWLTAMARTGRAGLAKVGCMVRSSRFSSATSPLQFHPGESDEGNHLRSGSGSTCWEWMTAWNSSGLTNRKSSLGSKTSQGLGKLSREVGSVRRCFAMHRRHDGAHQQDEQGKTLLSDGRSSARSCEGSQREALNHEDRRD